MQVCANCGHVNRPGVLFCENCGTSLSGKAAVGTTKSFEEEQAEAATGAQLTGAGTDYFVADSTLRIEIEGGPEPIVVRPKQELVFGRRDPATGAMPDIDLTPYAGYRMGVSRRHAAIRTADDNHLDVWDLGSSNGTFLNGQRLNAHRPYRLRDGDQLRLGQMVIRVFFQPPERRAAGEPVASTTRPTAERMPVAQPSEEAAPAVEESEAPAAPKPEAPAAPKLAEAPKPEAPAAPKPAEAPKSEAPAAPKPAEAAKPEAPAAPKPVEAAKPETPAAPKPAEAAKPKAPAAPKSAEAAKPEAPAAPKPAEAAKPEAPAAPKSTEAAKPADEESPGDSSGEAR